METLERSRVCRLCGKHAGITIDIFEKRGNHVKKINSVLPILVHEMDLLPKHICHPCNYKLEEFHKFYEDCLKTDANLKGQLSWMRGSVEREETTGLPMVQIKNFIIKTEPPDYDDEETTTSAEAILYSGNMRNGVDKNYSERIVSASATKCSRCGCYCGKRNGIVEEPGKSRLSVRHINEKNNNGQFTSRDTIRRNLFATEIFGDKSPRIQTEIPIRNIPGGVTSEEVNALVSLEMLGSREKGERVGKKLKMADDTKKIKVVRRTLRPRKTDGSTRRVSRGVLAAAAAAAAAAADVHTGGTDNRIESNGFKSVEIKVEASGELERILRPRIETIDYSESRRKNPMARRTDGKRNDRAIVEGKIVKNPEKYVNGRIIKFDDPTAVIKLESEVSTESSKTWHPLGNSKEKSLKKIVPSSPIVGKTWLLGSSSCSGPKSREKMTDGRRSLPENRPLYASPYLRSQRSQLRNGKLKKLDSIVEEPKKFRCGNVPRRILSKSIKRETREINEKAAQTIFKHRHCDMCNSRFASAELYMLHHCYANKRH